MASSSGDKVSMPLFHGDDYASWKVKMRTYLMSEGLWCIVANGYLEPSDETTLPESKKKELESTSMVNAKALSKLQNGVGVTIFPRIIRARSAKEAWDIIAKEFEGTQLLVKIAKIHHDPKLWPNPEEFKPKRFLTTHKHIDYRGQDFELIPFKSGRRICLGMSLASESMLLTLANLLHGFDIASPTGGPVDMTEGPGFTLHKANPLEVLLTPSFPAHLYA
ncbi:cytochrome P450 82A3-like [Tripterygium wilfordii]|uniref:cytochrome P450 82A3-like n=1 Tax=Tripterygium wilfordii TaxID=458696 RepID=UPI0018F8238A|nr:cytochrome P450 82A3-like [Tripterygium wilfordii]